MKNMFKIKKWAFGLGIITLATGFTQCASSQKIDEKAPVVFKDAYFQKWAAGIQEGGYGYTVYLPVEGRESVKLDSLYFRDRGVALEKKTNENVYIGNINYGGEIKKEIIISSDVKEEAQNELPDLKKEKIPFELKGNECVISYTKGNKKGYFKVDDLKEKKSISYPMQIQQ